MAKTAVRYTDEERQAKIAALQDTFKQGVEDLIKTPGAFKTYLQVQAKFHRYSFNNVMLIKSQRPNATLVKGFKSWLSVGRQVRKGERGISIWAPVPVPERRDDAGNVTRASGLFFRPTTVFDISQTDPLPGFKGKPLTVATFSMPDITGNPAVCAFLYRVLSEHARSEGVTIREVEGGTPYGSYRRSTKTIEVRRDACPVMLTSLIHEYGHHLVADAKRDKKLDVDNLDSYAAEEVVVESMTYIVCEYLGIGEGTKDFSTAYVATWLQSDSKGFEKGMKLVQSSAHRIIEVLERALANAEEGALDAPVPAAPLGYVYRPGPGGTQHTPEAIMLEAAA